MGQLKDVLITEQLSRRPARPTDYEALCEALLTLSRVMADAPEKVLQRVAETAMELCRAETAGISLLEEQPGGEFVFRWHAIAGKFSAHLRGMAPRDFSPCGIVVDSGQPQLFLDPARCFPYLAEAQPKIKESLLVPFFINGKPVGTLWLMSHNDQHMFDAEDVRIISKLGEFCSGALQVVHSLQGDAPTSLVADKLIGQQPAVHEAQLKREQLLQSQLGVAQREIERRFHLVVQNLTDYAIMMLDLEGHVTAWNEGARRIKHYTEQEIVGQHFSIFYPPEELAVGRPQQEMATARSTGRSEVEGFRVRKNGERFWCNEIVTTVHDDKGTLVGFAKISRDLTESKALQDALREREELHRLLIDNARDFAIMMIDLNGTIASWNSGAERVFGFTETEAVGQKTAILFTAEDRAEGVPVKELATASSEGRAIDERWQIRKGGERFWASGVTTPLRDAVGGTRGFVKICRDLTERKQFEDQRNRLLEQEQIARLEAEQAVRMKDEFLAVISHELRTPLTSILLWAKLLRSGTVKAAGEPEALRAIEQGAVAQQQLIEDLLDMSRIISGKLRLNVQQADFSPVVRSAVDTLRPMADAKGVRIHIALDDGLDPVRIDPDRMQQVVWNLVSNAVKFTDKGGSVRVTASRHDDRVVLKVTDTGRGISPGFLPFIFDSFRQADSGTTRGYGGLGLGMAITRQLVELHGGTARAESEGEGKGATFSVELPQTVILSEETPTTRPPVKADSKTAGEPLPHLDGVRLLLVEDEVGARTALQWLLERSGAEVTAVESAVRAVDAFRDALREPHPFNVIVSDIGMPIMDGYEMIGHLRSLEHQAGAAAPTPAIALTAFARVEDCAKAKKAGYQMHVAKPIEPGRLVSLVANVLQTTP